ncbi:MAG: glycoside hydrolase family 88 protein, partial [Clostridium sp.]
MVFERYFRDYIHEFNQLDRKNWNYEDGCVLIGMQALYEATGEDLYFTSIQNFIDRYVGEDGSIEYYDILEFNIDRIPSGRVFYLLYEKTGKEKYRKAIELLMKQLRSHPRTDCGNFWHKKIYPYQIWLDG